VLFKSICFHLRTGLCKDMLQIAKKGKLSGVVKNSEAAKCVVSYANKATWLNFHSKLEY
jgi:hypothetical protein